MLNPGPNFRRIPCPSCGSEVEMASGSARLECRNLRRSYTAGGRVWRTGHCDFATRDYSAIPVGAGEMVVVVDFTPFIESARTETRKEQ